MTPSTYSVSWPILQCMYCTYLDFAFDKTFPTAHEAMYLHARKEELTAGIICSYD